MPSKSSSFRNIRRAAPLSRPGEPRPATSYWGYTTHCSTDPSKLQAGFARRVGHCLHAPVIEKPVAVEHHALDALLEQPLGDRLADGRGAADVAAAGLLGQRALDRRLDRRGRGDRLARGVVDDLHVHVADAAEHRQPGPRFVTADALAQAVLDPVAAIFLGLDTHRYFAPVLPTFFLSTSPV